MDPDRASGAVVLRAAKLDSIGRGNGGLFFGLGNLRIRRLWRKELIHQRGVFASRENLDNKISGLDRRDGRCLPEAPIRKL
jgi:hypothetical protein